MMLTGLEKANPHSWTFFQTALQENIVLTHHTQNIFHHRPIYPQLHPYIFEVPHVTRMLHLRCRYILPHLIEEADFLSKGPTNPFEKSP